MKANLSFTLHISSMVQTKAEKTYSIYPFLCKNTPGRVVRGLVGAGRPGGYTAAAVGTAGMPAPDQEMEPPRSIQCAAPSMGGSPVRLR